MLNLEVQIVSREIIKPSSPEIQNLKPFKICLFDQLIPSTYVTTIIFYSLAETNVTITMALARLKTSLSETLNILYPFSGRMKDNMFIDRFDEGVPFLSARISCRLSEFLKHHEIESLNKLLPCQPFTKESNNEDHHPLLVCQATIFACGGLALGLGMSHKITDVQTGFNLVNVWSTICRGSYQNAGNPPLAEASIAFPPRNQVPQNYISMMENLWFTEANYRTRRFIFEANAIAKLKDMAKGEYSEATPTRIQALSGLIWKCFMEASRAVSGSAKPSILVQAVSLRPRRKPNLLHDSIGNLFWWGIASSLAEKGTKVSELVDVMKESVAAFDDEYLDSLQGEQGFEAISEYFDQLEAMFSSEKPDILGFTSWCNLGYYKLDYGWGNPTWFALFGKVGSAFRNHTVFVETKCGKGIEAWITLDEERMLVLEKDPEFLKFASPNLKISSL
ncbi:Transferase [Corchorus olitorius]|uniref:Transferase n=1 Tax=Corchorus olitorius TaxID=93759 RepID=A0A1R3G821_9ROSI|nr:Transferase [Corchorus olitorius]